MDNDSADVRTYVIRQVVSGIDVKNVLEKNLKKTFENVSPDILFNLLPNVQCCRCSIAVTRGRENFIQFVAIHDFTH